MFARFFRRRSLRRLVEAIASDMHALRVDVLSAMRTERHNASHQWLLREIDANAARWHDTLLTTMGNHMSDSASRLNAATDRILAAVADVGAKVTAEAAEVQAAIDALRSNTDVEVGIARLDGVVTDLQAIGASVEAIVDPANPGGTAPASGGTTDPLTGDPIPPSDPFGP